MQEERRSKAKKTIKIIAAVVLIAAAAVAVWFILGGKEAFEGLENTIGISDTPVSEIEGLSITYFDVGQGDCALAVCGGKTMLIDAGEAVYSEKIIRALNSLGIRKLDYAVCSHFHSDHIGSMPSVIDEFAPSQIIMPALSPEYVPDTYIYGKLLESIGEYDAEIINPMPGDEFGLGGAVFTVLGPLDELTENQNDISLVIKLTYGERSFLFTGDAEKDEEKDIIDSGADLESDVLKAGHHGSSNSSSLDFLAAVSPSYCIISVGKDNDYGHPHERTINNIMRFTDKIYRTDICGDIHLTCDGKEIRIDY
ncbi:MAG: MBL fold metallo-hydrolase [Clostridia bacterium]|nr:MBL fold metallo-hydrolase [Clostridia bacterium]